MFQSEVSGYAVKVVRSVSHAASHAFGSFRASPQALSSLSDLR